MFVVTAIMNMVVVALALFVLKPMRARQMAQALSDAIFLRGLKAAEGCFRCKITLHVPCVLA